MVIPELDVGTFLIATPEIKSGIFFRSVILICEHSMEGTFGLVVNKPFDASFPKDQLGVDTSLFSSLTIRSGGPLDLGRTTLLHTQSMEEKEKKTAEVCKGVFLGNSINVLEKLPKSDPVAIYMGYAAWIPGQLEMEVANGVWVLAPASQEEIFSQTPDYLWRQLLQNIGGDFALMAMFPEDLMLN